MTAITTGDGAVVRIAGSDPNPELRDVVSDVDSTVASVGTTSVASVEPLVAVTRDGRTAFYADPSPDRLREVAAALDGEGGLGGGGEIEGGADAVVDHDTGTATFPATDLPGLDVGVRRVLGGCGWRRPTNPDDHAAAGGFADVDPDAAVDVAERLRGRGWGDWSHDEALGDTWQAAMEAAGDVAVVVNGHGSVADALLLASAPFEALEGADATARAVGADQVLVYVSREDERALARVREAAENYPDPTVPVDVVEGPPSYRAAEPTMALEALEGNHRLEARLRPPGPEEVGLHGQPTLVHTARTFAHLAVALRDESLPETRVVTVAGDVTAPATVELPETSTVEEALGAVGVVGDTDGGGHARGAVKAACVGGRFGGVTASLDVPLDPDALSDADLGTEGTVEVIADGRCLVEFVGKRAQFAADANCGRCVPCREGTTQLANLLREIYDGDYDAEKLEELIRVMGSTSICEFGVSAGRPTRTAMAEFGGEFEAHADGRCPSGTCMEPQEARL